MTKTDDEDKLSVPSCKTLTVLAWQ